MDTAERHATLGAGVLAAPKEVDRAGAGASVAGAGRDRGLGASRSQPHASTSCAQSATAREDGDVADSPAIPVP